MNVAMHKLAIVAAMFEKLTGRKPTVEERTSKKAETIEAANPVQGSPPGALNCGARPDEQRAGPIMRANRRQAITSRS
jgi:hypothetical protein